ncbi:hypothetical protein JTE90_006851 [Oedothorax gibbosus]|uniref:Centriolar coiled-coil protein of 110 kDa n=1 Tax=Oedothorax gibbosus TaxID=931172 RepID=A0AAV6TW34_9ARAC|nr:hypothetical protein JTE90_006851 [Oedothorax gibbosus]
MSFIDSNPSMGESLKRLEEFSTFNSCIKCLGRSIIPPLLTLERREEACRYRYAATKIQEEKEKKKLLSASDVADCRVQNHLSSCNNNDFIMHNAFENTNSALLATTVIDIQACTTNAERNFLNEMHISTCKMTSSNICSTVHKDVIVFPRVNHADNDTEYLSKSDTTIPYCYSDQNEIPLAPDNVSSSEVNNEQDLQSIVSPMPCKSASNNNSAYLPKNYTNCCKSVLKDKSEAQITLCNIDLCEDVKRQNVHYSGHVLPCVTVPASNTEYIHKSDKECIQGPRQLNTLDFYESNNKQNLPPYLPESNSKCPSSDQGDSQFSLENADPCKDSNQPHLSSLVSEMPYASGPTNEIPCVGSLTVEMPYSSGPTVEMSLKSGSNVEMSEKSGSNVEMSGQSDSTIDMPYEKGSTVEISHGIGPAVKLPYGSGSTEEISNENGPTVEMLYGSCPTLEMPLKIGSTIDMPYGSAKTMEMSRGNGPTVEKLYSNCSTVEMPLKSGSIVEIPLGNGLEMPHGTYPTEEMASVSEDEPDSNTESLEFGSLPTVISAGHFALPQDTDNESNVTCLTQSTDLEKYLDCSIEYSSPDDARTLSRSQESSQLNTSERSDDGSSETLVNTGSETTPCASAIAMTTSYVVENYLQKFINDAVDNQRANSADSYLLKTRPKELPILKSQSEPKQFPTEVSLKSVILDLKNAAGDSKHNSGPVSESEVLLSFEDARKSLKRKHVRSNSYTLEGPSPALIMAHADCNCSQDPNNLSPHSCSSEKLNFSTPNLAFKKEKVKIDRLSSLDRKKFFPILSSASVVIVNQTNANRITDSKISNEPEMKLAEVGYENIVQHKDVSASAEMSSVNESQVENLKENVSKEHTEEPSETNSSDASTQRLSHPREVTNVENVNNNINEIVNQVIRDMKELQKNRVSEFMEEQKKLWLQMQEEFKEQERLLCEKLNAVNIAPLSDGTLSHSAEMNGNLHPVIKNCIPVTNSDTFSILDINLNEAGDGPSLKSSHDKSSEAEAFKISHFNSIPTDASSNLQNTELPYRNIQDSKSTASLPFTTNDTDESKSSPNQSSSLSTLPVDSGEDRSVSVQSSMSSKFLNTPSQDLSSDYPETIHSGLSPNSLNTNSQDLSNENQETMYYRTSSKSLLSEKQETLHSSMSSMSLNTKNNDFLGDNPETIHSSRSLNTQILGLSEKQETIPSSISETSVDADSKSSVEAMQSLYNNCPISQLSVPEGSYSSMSYRSISSLSQTSDMVKIFRDFQFANENNCFPVSPGKVCRNQEHTGRESIGSECSNSFARRLYFDNLSDDGNKFFTTPISPSEFIPSPAVFQQQKSLTSSSLHAMQFQGSDFGVANFEKNNSFDLGTLAHISSDQKHLFNNTPIPNLNHVAVTNTRDNKSDVEAEIRAINDVVQSSYASSYHEKGRNALSNNSNKNHSHGQNNRGLSDIPLNATSSVEKGASKQNITSSMTNLKRRQSRDILKDPALLKKFEKLPALVKGYLTRRLFKSERVQDLIRILRDTAMLVGKCSQELNSKGNSVSENDVEFHRQLISQLMRTFDNVYDIFCTMSVGEQMKIIAESRQIRLKKNSVAKKESAVLEIAADKCRSSPSKKPKLSSATMKALERKRSSIHSRTYIVEDMKRNKSRVSSNNNSLSRVLSPSRIYKTSVGTPVKRKTKSLCKPSWK